MTKELDLKDKQLLYALDQNARQSLSEISKKLRLGRDIVGYRFNRLINNGYILGLHALVNPFALNYTVYKTYLKLEAKPLKVRALLASLKSNPKVYWSALSYGNWDMFYTFLAESPEQAHYLEDSLLSDFADLIIEKETAVNIDILAFNKDYLSKNSGHGFKYATPKSLLPTDALDFKIIRALAKNARVETLEMSKKFSVSPITITKRIEIMEANDIIIGYRPEIDLKKIGRTFFKARIYSAHISKENEEKLLKYCHKIREITYCVRQIGSCPIELSLEVKSYESLTEIINNLKENFLGVIKRVEILPIGEQSYKWGI